MADLTVGSSGVRAEFADRCTIRPRTAAAAITAGQALYLNTSGKVDLLDTNASGKHQFLGISLDTKAAGETVRSLEEGWVYGFDLSGVAYDGVVFGSDTAGALADAAGTASVSVGRCDCLNDNAKTKILYIPPRPAAAFS